MRTRLLLTLLVAVVLTTAVAITALAQSDDMDALRRALFDRLIADRTAVTDAEALADVACLNGMASVYPCQNVDLLEFLPLSKLGGGQGNDIWGWTDPETGHEYAIMGLSGGTAFVDITNGAQLIGRLPTHTTASAWRDIKVYRNHAYIVSEASSHGMQVFDLTQLRDVTSPPVTFSETAHYDSFGSAHNIAINTDAASAYVVGSNTCAGGLHMISLKVPASPTFSGCYSDDGYTHDTQCVDYAGPDTNYSGREICFSANEDTLTIVDVTSKDAPVQLARAGYTGRGYAHQGWLTEDHHYFLLDDELDESNFGHGTRTYIWDVSDLSQPQVIGTYTAETPAIDHNLYVKGNLVYQANYRAGMRILDATDVANGTLTEVGYFDIFPASDSANFNGAWSVYPYFASGKIVVSGIEQGLFVLRYGTPEERFSSYVPFAAR